MPFAQTSSNVWSLCFIGNDMISKTVNQCSDLFVQHANVSDLQNVVSYPKTFANRQQCDGNEIIRRFPLTEHIPDLTITSKTETLRTKYHIKVQIKPNLFIVSSAHKPNR